MLQSQGDTPWLWEGNLVVSHKCTLSVLVLRILVFARHFDRNLLSITCLLLKGESQQEAVAKGEEPSANSRTAGPRGPPRKPGGGEDTLPCTHRLPLWCQQSRTEGRVVSSSPGWQTHGTCASVGCWLLLLKALNGPPSLLCCLKL